MFDSKKLLWIFMGIICLIVAYISFICPWVPISPPILAAAYCFSNGSEKLDHWINNNGLFGPIINDWKAHRIFPTTWKLILVIAAELSLLGLWSITNSVLLIMAAATILSIGVVWIWRYPGSTDEKNHRIENNKKIGWF